MGLCNAVTLCLSGAYVTFFLISGIALIAYGSFTAYTILVTNSEETIHYFVTILPSAITILFGLVLVILVIVGCCGICRESKYCVESYSAILILLALCQLAFGGYCIITYGEENYKYALSDSIHTHMANLARNYRHDPDKMDRIQNWMNCCGHVDAMQEYGFLSRQESYGKLPISCCGRSSYSCSLDKLDPSREGCTKRVIQFTIVTNYIMGWISIVVGTSELIAALLGVCLSCCVWRNQMGSWR